MLQITILRYLYVDRWEHHVSCITVLKHLLVQVCINIIIRLVKILDLSLYRKPILHSFYIICKKSNSSVNLKCLGNCLHNLPNKGLSYRSVVSLWEGPSSQNNAANPHTCKVNWTVLHSQQLERKSDCFPFIRQVKLSPFLLMFFPITAYHSHSKWVDPN